MKIVLVAALMGLVFQGQARAETLNLLIWEKYISDAVVEKWQQETGVSIRQIYFDNGDDRDRLLADPKSDIDLAILNENITALYSRNGRLVKIDESNVPSIAYSKQRWRERCEGYAIPYFWGTLGIVYRADKITTPPTSWKDILTPPPEIAGHLAMTTGYDDFLSPALIMLGKSISSENPDDLKAAFEILKAQSPSVATYDYIITSAQDKKIGDNLYAAMGYSGDQFVLSETTGKPWKYALPSEGSVLWVDCLAANANSPRRDLAVRFLNFINRPDIAAQNAAAMSLPTTNEAALPLLPAEMRSNPEIYPSEMIIKSSQFYNMYGASVIQLRKRIVSTVISGHDAQ